MIAAEDDILLLTKIGFTRTQAKVYLTLVSTGENDAKILSKRAQVPRQAAYRTLNELQEKGLVERIISLPQVYKAIPIQNALAIMVSAKANEYAEVIQKSQDILSKLEVKEDTTRDEEYKISIVEGKETIVSKTKNAHDSAQHTIDCCTTFQRWTQMGDEIAENLKKALKRGVKYRTVLQVNDTKIHFSKTMLKIMANPDFQVRLTRNPLRVNVVIFDDKEASVSFYPSKALTESPMIWTNHPSFLIGFHDHFEKLWATASQIEANPLNNS